MADSNDTSLLSSDRDLNPLETCGFSLISDKDACLGSLGDFWRTFLMEDSDKLSEEDWRCKGGEVFDFFSFTESDLSVLVLEGKLALSPLAVAMTKDCKEGPMDLRF